MFEFVEKKRNILIWFVLIVSVVFVFYGVDFSGNNRSYLASVNGHKISMNDIQSFNDGNMSQNELLQIAISRQLLLEAADDYHLIIPAKQIREKITSLFQTESSFDDKLYLDFLKNHQITALEFEKNISDDIKINELMKALNKTIPSKAINKKIGEYLSQSINISTYQIDAKTLVSSKNITDTEITKYYDEHKTDFIIPASVDLEYVIANSDIDIDKLHDDIYKNHKNINVISQEYHLDLNVVNINKQTGGIFADKNLQTILSKNKSIFTQIENGYLVGNIIKQYNEHTEKKEEAKAKVLNILMSNRAKEIANNSAQSIAKNLNNNKAQIIFQKNISMNMINHHEIDNDIFAQVMTAYQNHIKYFAYNGLVYRINDITTNKSLIESNVALLNQQYNSVILETYLSKLEGKYKIKRY